MVRGEYQFEKKAAVFCFSAGMLPGRVSINALYFFCDYAFLALVCQEKRCLCPPDYVIFDV
jgi:hypothetical protein